MRARKYPCLFYLNENENNHFQNQLFVTGLTKSEFLRELIMGADIRPIPSDEIMETYKLVAELTNNTDQIAKVANATGYVDPIKIDGLLLMVDKCWGQIKKIS